MNSLSQYHPFRDSVNKTGDATAPVPSENVITKDDNDIESNPRFSFKTKMRMAIGVIGFTALWWVISSIFSGETLPQNGFYSILDKDGAKKAHAKKTVEPTNSIFDEHDLDVRGRNVSEAKSKAGFISSLFCKGGKKASFCDD